MIRHLNLGKNRIFPAPVRYRRQVRTSYTVALVVFVFALYAALSNLAFGGPRATMVSVAAMFGAVLSGWLHQQGRHTLARVTLLCTANFWIFTLSFFLDPNSNISLALLTYVGLPFIVMSWRENRQLVLCLSALPFVLWILLMLTNYGNGAFVEVDPGVSKIFGYSHSILVFCGVALEFAFYDWVTQRYSRALRRSLRAEVRANEAKTAFLSSMSHEMRNPLNAVLGAADLLAHHPQATPDIKRLAKAVADGGDDLLALTEKSLAYARITAGPIEADLKPADPMALIEPVIERFRDKIARKDIELAITKTNHHKVLVDPSLFTETVAQIFENAVSYAPNSGAVKLRIEDGEAGMVKLVISDNGPGVPKDRLGDVFKAFERLDQTYGTNSGGGVGLTIAKTYVGAMRGRIGICPDDIPGARVWVEVPSAA